MKVTMSWVCSTDEWTKGLSQESGNEADGCITSVLTCSGTSCVTHSKRVIEVYGKDKT
jgi:hypothetical protein